MGRQPEEGPGERSAMIERVFGEAILGVARLLTGARARWIGCAPSSTGRIYIANRSHDPIPSMLAALDAGDSLILFPEGTRNPGEELLPFKSGLYHLAMHRPAVEIVPVWIANLNRVLPKGEFLPVPLLCSLAFGGPIRLEEGEDKTDFLARARRAVMEMKGQ